MEWGSKFVTRERLQKRLQFYRTIGYDAACFVVAVQVVNREFVA